MQVLKVLRQEALRFVRHTWALPQTVAAAVKLRRQQQVLDARETERLDRIRHPYKYLGKS